MKYRISTRTSFVTISLLIFLIMTMYAVFANCNLNSIANASYNQSQKDCILSVPNIEDDYDDSSIIVCMDNVVGGINRIHDASFFGEFAKEVNDLTYITGDIDDKEYLDKENFTQILQITLKYPSKQNVINAINFMKNVPGVLSASPNWMITAEQCSLYPTYPLEGENYRNLWGLHGKNGIDVENAWYMSDGNESIRVAVIDGGIAEHEDLTSNLVEGWDFVNNNNITNDDVFGHGTHVAGIIGAWGTTEDTGVVGVCPNVQLVPLQVYNNSTSTSPKYIYEAITWSINNNIDIINLSSEDPSEYIEMRSAIGNFKGLFVCAAGNYGKDNDITKIYPAYYSEGLPFSDRVISVGAIDIDGKRGVWSDVKSSNYGKNSVSIFAPGTQILSTVPTSVSESGYGYNSGTSMAAPHVTGVAALLYAVYMNVEPSLTRSQIATKIKTTIINSATHTSQMLEMCRARGILNATNALSSVMFNISYVSDGISITGLKQQFNNYKVTIPPMIEGLPVVRIANNAFRNQTTLTDIEIPSTVVSIGANAFEDCTALKIVTFEQDSNLTNIGNSAFDGCTNLLSIDIPNSVVSLGDNTFLNCTRLVGVSFESNSILQNIGNATFYNCTALSAITIPASVTEIGANAFENCLLSIRCDFEAYSALENIGNSAFANCDGLKSITLPVYMSSIGHNAFLSCDKLEYLAFHNRVDAIGSNAFAECPKLTIYTTQFNIPSGWMNGWNSSNRPVLFYCGISYMNEEEEPYVSVVEKGDTNPMNANAENGISNPYRFGYDFGGWYLTDDFSGTKYDTISSAPNGDLYAKWILKESCVAQGTMITLADGTQKPVEQLTGNEMLLVWNMFTGTFDVAPILFIDSEAGALYEIVKLRFSDGSEVKVISEHGFWDVDLNKYVFLRKDAAKYIGHWFNKQITDENGNIGWTTVQLVAVDVYKEYTTAWSPVTYQHLCYYVNGMLSMPGATEGLVNTFNVNPATMKIDEESLNADLEQYGEFTYEEFVDIFPIPQSMFDALNGIYLKVAIGKGYLTMQELSFLIDRYSVFFEIE